VNSPVDPLGFFLGCRWVHVFPQIWVKFSPNLSCLSISFNIIQYLSHVSKCLL
jgi:hypothetical protein